MRASFFGHVEVVRALLAAGADVDAADNHGYSALIWASWFGLVEVVRALLAAGADKHLAALNGDTAYSDAAHTPAAPPPPGAAALSGTPLGASRSVPATVLAVATSTDSIRYRTEVA